MLPRCRNCVELANVQNCRSETFAILSATFTPCYVYRYYLQPLPTYVHTYQLPTYLCTYPYTFTLEIVTETDNREEQGALSRNSNYSCFQSDRPRSCIEKQRGCSASTVLYPLFHVFFPLYTIRFTTSSDHDFCILVLFAEYGFAYEK